ncbi:MAG: outer membrane lipoprotein-sorting protein [Deltaproteobacteria bacterium]|nr:outer membrane lipoprotein-sorting protein [Deltaproteobacteria bacterium]
MKLTMALATGLLLLAVPMRAHAEDEARIRALLDRTDDVLRGKSSHGKMTMKVVTKDFTRELTLEQWSRGKDQFLVRILEPQKERGTATLRNGNDIWNYLPKVERVIKVPASLMGGAWMGSHVTNDDLVKQSRLADDFKSRISFEGKRDGKDVIEVELVPRPDAVVVWGKLIVRIGMPEELPTGIDYFDEDLKLARTLRFSDVKKLGGRMLPARTTVVPADKPNESTEILYQSLEFDVPLDDSFFSLRQLQK